MNHHNQQPQHVSIPSEEQLEEFNRLCDELKTISVFDILDNFLTDMKIKENHRLYLIKDKIIRNCIMSEPTSKTDLFYLFRTQVDNIYKFGMSSVGEERLRKYCGLNIPKKIFLKRKVVSGFMEEHFFKEFLHLRKIPIVYGNEFFKFDGSIEVLIKDYDMMNKKKYRTIRQRVKEENVINQKERSKTNRRLHNSSNVIHRCKTCRYETKIAGNLKHHHNKSKIHIDNMDKLKEHFKILKEHFKN